MESNIKEKVLKILDDFGMTGSKAAEAMGVTYATFRNKKNDNAASHSFNVKNYNDLVNFIKKTAIELNTIPNEENSLSLPNERKKFKKRSLILERKLKDLHMHFNWNNLGNDHECYVKFRNEKIFSKIYSGMNIYVKLNNFFDDIEKEILKKRG